MCMFNVYVAVHHVVWAGPRGFVRTKQTSSDASRAATFLDQIMPFQVFNTVVYRNGN